MYVPAGVAAELASVAGELCGPAAEGLVRAAGAFAQYPKDPDSTRPRQRALCSAVSLLRQLRATAGRHGRNVAAVSQPGKAGLARAAELAAPVAKDVYEACRAMGVEAANRVRGSGGAPEACEAAGRLQAQVLEAAAALGELVESPADLAALNGLAAALEEALRLIASEDGAGGLGLPADGEAAAAAAVRLAGVAQQRLAAVNKAAAPFGGVALHDPVEQFTRSADAGTAGGGASADDNGGAAGAANVVFRPVFVRSARDPVNGRSQIHFHVAVLLKEPGRRAVGPPPEVDAVLWRPAVRSLLEPLEALVEIINTGLADAHCALRDIVCESELLAPLLGLAEGSALLAASRDGPTGLRLAPGAGGRGGGRRAEVLLRANLRQVARYGSVAASYKAVYGMLLEGMQAAAARLSESLPPVPVPYHSRRVAQERAMAAERAGQGADAAAPAAAAPPQRKRGSAAHAAVAAANAAAAAKAKEEEEEEEAAWDADEAGGDGSGAGTSAAEEEAAGADGGAPAAAEEAADGGATEEAAEAGEEVTAETTAGVDAKEAVEAAAEGDGGGAAASFDEEPFVIRYGSPDESADAGDAAAGGFGGFAAVGSDNRDSGAGDAGDAGGGDGDAGGDDNRGGDGGEAEVPAEAEDPAEAEAAQEEEDAGRGEVLADVADLDMDAMVVQEGPGSDADGTMSVDYGDLGDESA
ncbi:hypothetical protein GPECTOR_169g185 [Gonium pectorale]|uniref:Uncharacterized protein n=1 Tax=Gonium pectorale TaxID=33097 RepID=A0A150FXD9_GONPE|nr:hypothetical protein GPECTOR_169g185 [Gonium pectorale]|eukprot:KXZ42281.1 hypothetical protein GPECTOR_169g185 [Gonium pectorale]